jgi:hypothetical protein
MLSVGLAECLLASLAEGLRCTYNLQIHPSYFWPALIKSKSAYADLNIPDAME